MASTLLFLLFLAFLFPEAVKSGSVGFCYGRNGDNLPSPEAVAQLLVRNSISKVRIYDYNSSVIQAFANTNFEVIITIPNEELSSFQTEQQADAWVNNNLAQLRQSAKITVITVGVEVATLTPQYSSEVLPAMMNVHTGLTKANLASEIKVSTANSMGILKSSFPPSSGAFNDSIATSYVKPILDYLKAIGSFYMVNAYPYHAYTSEADQVALDYALFQPKEFVVDPKTNLSYSSMLMAQVDAVYFAMEALGHSELSVMISETGWPTKGDADEPAANVANAATYNSNLLRLAANNTGTPRRPGQALNAYIFSVYDENRKTGKESERHWGVFDVQGNGLYFLDVNNTQNGAPQSLNGTGATWCVALPSASNESLEAGLNYACGKGNADCGPVQQGQACFNPNTFLNHASYAYNSYYQRSGDNTGACDFGGTAMITSSNPSYGACIFETDAVANSGGIYANTSSAAAPWSSWTILAAPLVLSLL